MKVLRAMYRWFRIIWDYLFDGGYVWLCQGVATQDGGHTTFELCRPSGSKMVYPGLGSKNFALITDQEREELTQFIKDQGYTLALP